MTESDTTVFTYHDPRYFEGDPYEVAVKAIDQVHNLANLLTHALDEADVLVRNAELQRQLDLCTVKHEPQAISTPYDETAIGKSMDTLKRAVAGLKHRLGGLSKASAYNPLNPPKD